MPLPPENLYLPMILQLLLRSLSWLEISPFPKADFFAFWSEIPTGKSFELICKWLMDCIPCCWLVFTTCFFLVSPFDLSILTMTSLKVHFCTVIHTTSPRKYVFVYLLFFHCLLVEVPSFFTPYRCYYDFFSEFSVLDCKNCLKVGIILRSIKLKTYFH